MQEDVSCFSYLFVLPERGIIAQKKFRVRCKSMFSLIAIKVNVAPADSSSIEFELTFLSLFERVGC